MKKLVSYLAATFLLSSTSWARPFTISYPDWPPFYVQDSNISSKRGIAMDITSACTSSITTDIKYDSYPIKRMFKHLENGDLDLNIMSFKADRAKFVDYGKEVLFENTYSIWVHANENRSIKSFLDLNSFSIAQLIGLRPSDAFNKWFEVRLKSSNPKESHVLNSHEQILKMLSSKRIEATAASSPETKWRGGRLGVLNNIKDTGYVLQKQPYFFVISKKSPYYSQDPTILARLDQCVRNLKRTGQWNELIKYYNL